MAKSRSTTEVMHEKNLKSVTVGQTITKILVKVIIYTFLITMAIIVVFPFYWMIISSLKPLDEYMFKQTFWPETFQWRNYYDALQLANLGRLFINTVLVGIVSTMLSLVITVLSAFAFARLEFKGKNALFAALLGTMMIPGELFTITNFQTVYNLGWIYGYDNFSLGFMGMWDNFLKEGEAFGFGPYVVMIVPFLVSVFYIYLLRQNFMQIPNELYLAAKVDGTSDLKYLWKVMIPLALPSLISITILKMMGSWNSYIWPRLVTANAQEFSLITNGLKGASFVDEANPDIVNYPAQMAAVVVVSIPLFLVFIFLRKYIMKGVSRSGIKG